MSHKVCKRDIRCITKFNVMGPKVKVTADVTPSEMLQDFFYYNCCIAFPRRCKAINMSGSRQAPKQQVKAL